MHNKQGFTLAEVLLTLSIIGVVAVIVMTVLNFSISDQISNVKAKVETHKISQSTDKMKTLGLMNQRYASTSDFVDELSNHLNIAKRCDKEHLTDCFPAKTITNRYGQIINTDDLKTSEGELGLKKWESDTEAFVMADGTPVLITYNKNSTSANSDTPISYDSNFKSSSLNDISIIIDTNTNGGSNVIGKDIRSYNNKLDLYKVKDSNFKIDAARASNTFYTAEECNKYIDNQYCCSAPYYCCNPSYSTSCKTNSESQNDKNYLATAIKDCDDKSGRIPSTAEFNKILSDLYGTSINFPWGCETKSQLNISNPILKELLAPNGTYLTTQQQQTGNNNAIIWHFSLTSTSATHNSTFKNNASFKYFCVYD